MLSRALLMAAVGLSAGHLLAVGEYQRARLDEAATRETETALVEHHKYQSLVERRTLALAGNIVLLAASVASARAAGEGVALFAVGFGVAGLTAALELMGLGYKLICWPFVPVLSGQQPLMVAAVHVGIVALVGVLYHSATRRAREAEKPSSTGKGRAGPRARTTSRARPATRRARPTTADRPPREEPEDESD